MVGILFKRNSRRPQVFTNVTCIELLTYAQSPHGSNTTKPKPSWTSCYEQ